MRRRSRKLQHLRVLTGIICMSMGFGMLVVLILPGWGFIAAAMLMIFGFWNVYLFR